MQGVEEIVAELAVGDAARESTIHLGQPEFGFHGVGEGGLFHRRVRHGLGKLVFDTGGQVLVLLVARPSEVGRRGQCHQQTETSHQIGLRHARTFSTMTRAASA